MGYLLAVISSLFFSLYVVPRKYSKLSPVAFSLIMSASFFVGSLLLFSIKLMTGLHEPLNWQLLWAIAAGVVWALGFVSFMRSVDILGLARSNQWKNLQGPVGVILSLIILGEYGQTRPIFAVLAGLAIFLSATALNIVHKNEDTAKRKHHINLALLSGVCFGTVSVINKHVTTEVGVYSQQVVWAATIALSLLVYIAITRRLNSLQHINRRELHLGCMAGLGYMGASVFMLESLSRLPASIAFPIIQLNGIWTVAIGLYVFREIPFRKNYTRISAGIVLALVGIFFLAFARL